MTLKLPPPLSIFLVLLQMLALVILATTAPLKCIRVELQIWELSGIFIAVSGLVSLGRKSFSVFPEPKKKAIFIRKGIYAFIRHPMYAGLLMISICLVIQFPSPLRWVSLVVLIVVFVVKIIREEKSLVAHYPEYKDYQQQTNRLIPLIW